MHRLTGFFAVLMAATIAGCGGGDSETASSAPAQAATPTAEATSTGQPSTTPQAEASVDPDQDARAMVQDYYAKVATGDAEGACALLTDAGQAATVATAGQTFKGESCEEITAQLAPYATDTKIRSVKTDGDTGTARTQTGSLSPATLKLVKTGDGWRVDGF